MACSHSHSDVSFGDSRLTLGPGHLCLPRLVGLLKERKMPLQIVKVLTNKGRVCDLHSVLFLLRGCRSNVSGEDTCVTGCGLSC